MNIVTVAIPDHKHCIYCGKMSGDYSYEGLACKSSANQATPGTNGERPHVYLGVNACTGDAVKPVEFGKWEGNC